MLKTGFDTMAHPAIPASGAFSDSICRKIRDYNRHPSKMFDRQQQKRLGDKRFMLDLMLAERRGRYKFGPEQFPSHDLNLVSRMLSRFSD